MNAEPIDLVVVIAMVEEEKPFLDHLKDPEDLRLLGDDYRGPATFVRGDFGGQDALIVAGGIGTTNAAVAVMAALRHFAPKAVIVAGTTGGLKDGIHTGDVVIADRVLYHEANAEVFGYVPGQLPRMPEAYDADPAYVELAKKSATTSTQRSWTGLVGSSNSFIMAPMAAEVRGRFPDLLAVDMETAAIAQVCWMFQIPWVSARAVSDLCAPNGGEEFYQHAPHAYLESFRLVLGIAESLS